jgi:mannosyltransferase OCH1-like enzyme
MRSFVDYGHRFELFTYDSGLEVPDWVVRKDASEILPTKYILHHHLPNDRATPTLHSDLFRMAMLQRLGGWWVDLDIVMLKRSPPGRQFFFAPRKNNPKIINNSVMRFSREHPLLREAVERITAIGERAKWDEAGSELLSELIRKYDLTESIAPTQLAYPTYYFEVGQLFDPSKNDYFQLRCSDAHFMHLNNDLRCRAGFPLDLGPPKDSFLDWLFEKHEFGAQFKQRMALENIERWLANCLERDSLDNRLRNLEASCREHKERADAHADVRIDFEAAPQSQQIEAERLRFEAERQRQELRAIKFSTSWRITKPLRQIGQFARAIVSRSRRQKNSDIGLIVHSRLFDRDWYLDRYPDVRQAGVDPVLHYLNYGASEGRDPDPLFDSNWYLSQYADVAESGMNPLIHYLRYGKYEGRQPCSEQWQNRVQSSATQIETQSLSPAPLGTDCTALTLDGRIQHTFRSFWHGPELGLYQLLCLRSFITHGHRVELFCYDDNLSVPDWIVRRNASDVLPVDRVLSYQSGFGRGSPALHSNLFRYALLHKLGGWWIDCDLVLLRPDVPPHACVFVESNGSEHRCYNGLMKLPANHPLLADAVKQCLLVGENANWGQTGPRLLSELIVKHDIGQHCLPSRFAYPIAWSDVTKLFDPDRSAEVRACCGESQFLHLFNEVWRGSGIPTNLGPPKGSFLDELLGQHDFGVRFRERMRYQDVARWIENRNQSMLLGLTIDRLKEDSRIAAEQCRALEAEMSSLRNNSTLPAKN